MTALASIASVLPTPSRRGADAWTAVGQCISGSGAGRRADGLGLRLALVVLVLLVLVLLR